MGGLGIAGGRLQVVVGELPIPAFPIGEVCVEAGSVHGCDHFGGGSMKVGWLGACVGGGAGAEARRFRRFDGGEDSRRVA